LFKIHKNIPLPEEVKYTLPFPESHKRIKAERDAAIRDVITGKSDKFLLIIGPCSADSPESVIDYVSRLAPVQEKTREKLVIIPRVYTNKPRTTGKGYKGMLHQPNPAMAADINAGIIATRMLHIRAVGESGLTAADEMLYPENIMFLDDILSYHAVGARSVENQQHRLAASGIEAPVGMKNPTSGYLTVMMNSILAAQTGHVFLYRQTEVETEGNPLAHAILRGSVNKHGENIANYHYEDLMKTAEIYGGFGLANPTVIVDVNHDNSGKKFGHQPRIARETLVSREYSPEIKALVKGLMIESYIVEGSQSVDSGVYGKSITDPCLGWEESERLIYEIAERV
jgi:3-deoxy-7-phosphoheptulonate synthase